MAASIIYGSADDLTLSSLIVKQDSPKTEGHPDIIDLRDEWGGNWMWDKLVYDKDLQWLSEALTAGSLVCVMDGSYDRARA